MTALEPAPATSCQRGEGPVQRPAKSACSDLTLNGVRGIIPLHTRSTVVQLRMCLLASQGAVGIVYLHFVTY